MPTPPRRGRWCRSGSANHACDEPGVVGGSGTNEASDGRRGFSDLLLRLVPAGVGGIEHTVGEMVVEQTQRDPLQRLGQRRNLGWVRMSMQYCSSSTIR